MTPVHLTAVGATTASINFALEAAGKRAIPYVGTLMWASDALTAANYYIDQYYSYLGVERFKVTYKWKYELDPLTDGGGIPQSKVFETKTVAIYE